MMLQAPAKMRHSIWIVLALVSSFGCQAAIKSSPNVIGKQERELGNVDLRWTAQGPEQSWPIGGLSRLLLETAAVTNSGKYLRWRLNGSAGEVNALEDFSQTPYLEDAGLNPSSRPYAARFLGADERCTPLEVLDAPPPLPIGDEVALCRNDLDSSYYLAVVSFDEDAPSLYKLNDIQGFVPHRFDIEYSLHYPHYRVYVAGRSYEGGRMVLQAIAWDF